MMTFSERWSEGTLFTRPFPCWQRYGNKQSQLETKQQTDCAWKHCVVCTQIHASASVSEYLSLVLQHFVSEPSAQLRAAGEIQPAALVQHQRRFPLPLAERSGNVQSGHGKEIKVLLTNTTSPSLKEYLVWKGQVTSCMWWAPVGAQDGWILIKLSCNAALSWN